MTTINKTTYKKIYYLLLMGFIINILLINFFIKPDRDALNFISQADGFVRNFFPSSNVYEYNITNYALLPFGHFIYGIYISILYFINPILVNLYSLKIINISFFLLTIYFVSKIINELNQKNNYIYFLFFLIILSISPCFIDIFYFSRPEIFGIFFTTAAIYFIIKNNNITASILLSINFSIHANFFILTLILTFFIFYKSITQKDFKYFIFVFIYYFAFALLYFIYFKINEDYSFNSIKNSLLYYPNIKNYFNSYVEIYKRILSINKLSLSAKIFYSFIFINFFLTIFFNFVFLIIIIIQKKISKNIVFILLFISIIITLGSVNTGKIQLFTSMSYFACLSLSAMLSSNLSKYI